MYNFISKFLDLCCYTFQQLSEIANIVSEIKWKPLKLQFTEMVCNKDSLYAILDKETDDMMKEFVSKIENEMRRRGIPVYSPRSSQQPVNYIYN